MLPKKAVLKLGFRLIGKHRLSYRRGYIAFMANKYKNVPFATVSTSRMYTNTWRSALFATTEL